MASDKAYLEAEKKIENTKQLEEDNLSLIGMGLTKLPESLKYRTKLHSLDLSFNKLELLPNWSDPFPELQSLNLGKNLLTIIPEWISHLTYLRFLSVSENNLVEIPESLGKLSYLRSLDLSKNKLTNLPESLGKLFWLDSLDLYGNNLRSLPDSFSELQNLTFISFSNGAKNGNPLGEIPLSVSGMAKLRSIWAQGCKLEKLPDWIGNLNMIQELILENNNISDLPLSLVDLENLNMLRLDGNPLNPELEAAYKQGISEVKTYLRAKAESQIALDEAKLILIGEGAVGKTCLMDALGDSPWEEHPSTHGIQIKPINLAVPDSSKTITLNAWDFGGQRVYRPTHQLFFSAPAVYLVVWKPREGSQAGQVKEWIQLVKRREPSAKILVVATHGGPQQRQPDIDRQELWDLFGKETVVDFFFIERKPDGHGNLKGIDELNRAIA